MSDHEPLACDLSAMDEHERREHARVAEKLFNAVKSVEELSDGYALQIPPDTALIQEAGAFISRERLCCPFFSFSLEVTPERGPVWLKVTGNEGVKRFIEQNMLKKLDELMQK